MPKRPIADKARRRSAGADASVLLVTNVLSHYRVPLFRLLAHRLPARLVFFSDGQERYWKKGNGDLGELPGRVLPGRWVGRTRVPRGLVREVARGRHDVVIKCINGKAALPLTYVAARLTRRRFVLWTGVWQHPRGLAHRIGRPLVRYIYRHADAVLTYGRHVSRHVAEQGVDPARIVVAAQAVDLTRFSIDGTSAPGPAGGQVLFVGRLEAAKGPQLLVEAWPAVVAAGIDARCTLVGEGPLRDALAARIAELGLTDQVRLAGSVPNADLPSVYRGADVTVIPSILTDDFAEPWSLAVNEAMGCGSLVIASTAVGAVRDGLVAGGCTGLTFPWGDVDALAHALIAALGDPRRRREMAAAGHAAVQSYSYAAAADGFARAVAIARAG